MPDSVENSQIFLFPVDTRALGASIGLVHFRPIQFDINELIS